MKPMADTDTAETETPEEVYRPERKATLRLGQRELNRITLIVIAIIAAALLYAGYRGMQGFKAHRDVMLARDHLLALHKAMQGYALDWDGHLPPADHWMDSVSGYLSAPPNTPGGPKSYLHGPGDGETV